MGEAKKDNSTLRGKATKQAKPQSLNPSPISGTVPPVHTRFGQPNGNKQNPGGIPKYVREIREELKNLLDPNLTIKDYQKIIKDAEVDSGLRGVFATAIVKKDYQTIIKLIDQAWGAPKASVDVTTQGDKINPMAGLTTEELRKLAGGDANSTRDK